MTYEEARKLISNGDLIAIRGDQSRFLNGMTAWATKSPYTHTGTAVWLEGRLWLSEMKVDGNHLVLLSHYKETDFDVFECPVDRDAYFRNALMMAEAYRGYEIKDLFLLLLKIKFGFKIAPDDGNSDVVCSGLSWLEYSACDPVKFPYKTRVAPSEIVAHLGQGPVISFRKT